MKKNEANRSSYEYDFDELIKTETVKEDEQNNEVRRGDEWNKYIESNFYEPNPVSKKKDPWEGAGYKPQEPAGGNSPNVWNTGYSGYTEGNQPSFGSSGSGSGGGPDWGGSVWDSGPAPSTYGGTARKKKSAAPVVIAFLLLVLLLGGGIFAYTQLQGRTPVVSTVPAATATPTPTPVPAVTPVAASPSPRVTPTPTPVPTPAAVGLNGDTTPRYFRTTLSGEELALYDKIANAMLDDKTELKFSASKKLFDRVFDIANLVLYDYPELEWYYGIGMMNYIEKGTEYDITLDLEQKYSGAARVRLQEKIDDYVNKCISSLGRRSEYDKVLTVYEYIINNTIYDYAYDEQSLLAVCTQGRGVCTGYQRTTQYMLQKLGIMCIDVSGNDHAWNYVKVDGEWYQLDTTWGDPITDDGSQVLSYGYFLLTDKEMLRDHTIEIPESGLPACTATKNNYYHKMGRYLEVYDRDTLINWIRGSTSGKLEFKCADKALFDRACNLCSGNDAWKLLEDAGVSPSKVSHGWNENSYVVDLYWE